MKPGMVPEHINLEHFEILPEHIDPGQIHKPTSEYTTPLLHQKMVNCTLNENEYRPTFITTLINNWYTNFYKHNQHYSQCNNDTKESLQITKLNDAQ